MENFVLDLDGVVVDSIFHGIPILKKLAIEAGMAVDDSFADFVRSLWGKHVEEFAPALTKKYGWSQKVGSEIVANFLIADYNNPAPMISGSKEAILNLKKIGNLMIITNRGKISLDYIMNPYFINPEWFVYYQHAEDGFPKKPHPQAMEKIIAETDGQPIYYIGDSVRDDFNMVKAAKKFYRKEITFLGVLSGVSTKDDFLKAGLSESKIFSDLLALSQSIS